MIYYRRNLPHIFIKGYAFFVTTRLDGSIPTARIKQLHNELENSKKTISAIQDLSIRKASNLKIQRKFFKEYELLLHHGNYGPHWLSDHAVAEIVKNSFHWGDPDKYQLYAFTIMPNHVHLVLKPVFQDSDNTEQTPPKRPNDKGDYFLSNLLQSIKKYSAREANKVLGRKGKFWQHENYDHLVRDYDELLRCMDYTLNNPIKAGLAKAQDDYKWNYVNWELLEE